LQLTVDQRPEWFSDVMRLLHTLRQNRLYPFIDKKVQVSWNAMMISALFTLADIDQSYLTKATDHLDALLKTMFIDGKLYHSTLIHTEPKVAAYLEEYAYLGRALVKAYESTFDDHYLLLAPQLPTAALRQHFDR